MRDAPAVEEAKSDFCVSQLQHKKYNSQKVLVVPRCGAGCNSQVGDAADVAHGLLAFAREGVEWNDSCATRGYYFGHGSIIDDRGHGPDRVRGPHPNQEPLLPGVELRAAEGSHQEEGNDGSRSDNLPPLVLHCLRGKYGAGAAAAALVVALVAAPRGIVAAAAAALGSRGHGVSRVVFFGKSWTALTRFLKWIF